MSTSVGVLDCLCRRKQVLQITLRSGRTEGLKSDMRCRGQPVFIQPVRLIRDAFAVPEMEHIHAACLLT
jgi:hypothetical protein